MTSRDLDEALSVAVHLTQWAQARISTTRPARGDAAEKSGPGDWVTSVDHAVEEHIRNELLARFPGDVVVGEEAGTSSPVPDDADETALTWYLDPIDGTTNFVHGLPGVSVSLAAVDAEGTALGVVHDVYRNEVFSAVRGAGARLDGTPIVAPASRLGLRGGLLLTEWSGIWAWTGMHGLVTKLQDEFTATRILGSCALSLASVGAGRATAAVLGGHYNPWDVLAGALIAVEAGCVMFDVDGRSDDVPMRGLGVADPEVADAIQAMWHAAVIDESHRPA
ncbi:inositol monophosphatase family protein [Phytoactinopolyspora halotolerans]|uniref:Inositol monophosphatase n=1 Tax=Phytoactinopolyspora halotolerans TaxID=1981512 RepID=A0A6L9S845_9ACTN|nr:inositol monophosphatase family protein [Phytoactinopolyspora halotolerans]NEE00742.1 inositol monophosphatase [Phytoactinopolyspora halotolerans]